MNVKPVKATTFTGRRKIGDMLAGVLEKAGGGDTAEAQSSPWYALTRSIHKFVPDLPDSLVDERLKPTS
jgi:hypothetical protein